MRKVILVILDGWGIGQASPGNAISSANTPTIHFIEGAYPSLTLQASGIAVGLPWGEEGNSEVGHLNMGAGRTVFQYLPRIIRAIQDGSFFENPTLKNAAMHVKKQGSRMHLMGLVSSGSVHSYIDHLYALLEFARREGISPVYLHVFTDGKDSFLQEAAKFLAGLEERMAQQGLGSIATLMGRSYAMDRNENWQYTQKAYELLTQGKGTSVKKVRRYLESSYQKGLNDQYIEPAIIKKDGVVSANDALIFFNFREDSARQITRAFNEEEFSVFPRAKIPNLFFAAMTQYEEGVPLEQVLFPPPNVPEPFAEILARHNKLQLRIAETEKYAHATYFFNGLNEKPFRGEERVLIPSFGSPHYEEHPEMSALKITEKALAHFSSFDFTLINYANADMLGHTGNLQAAIQGVEVIDRYLKKLLTAVNEETILIITADHGNAEEMLDPKTGKIKTQHTINPVPFYFVDIKKRGNYANSLVERPPKGTLADVAPTILELMDLPAPRVMTGQSLFPFLN